MSDYLPLKVVQLVLLRLPIKPLLRCSTACKAWYNLVTSRQFIYTHLNFLKSRPDSMCLFIEYREGTNYEYMRRHYVLYSDDKAGTIRELNRFEFPNESLHVVGCCNGLICIADRSSITSTRYEPEQEVILWNPIIRKTLHLPKSKMWSRFDAAVDSYLLAFGFVCDHVKNDYEVLRIYSRTKVRSMVEIFRLSTGLWEDISHKAAFSRISGRSPQAELNGISHWIGEDNNCELQIISFDVCEEVFDTIELPLAVANADVCYGRDWEKYLFCFEESLFLMCRVNEYDERKFEVWKMEEYNVVES